METTIEIQDEKVTALTKIVNESGLQLDEAETIKQSYLPYFAKLAEIKEQSQKIDFENPTELDEKIAKDLRLQTVKVRTGSETVKDDRKRIHMLKANIEQASWNLIKSTCLLTEEGFLQVEKKREIAEKARLQAIKTQREEELLPYAEFVQATYIDLANMGEEAYTSLLNGAKLQLEAKVESEKKAELERLEAARLEAEERERTRLENERLKAEAIAREAEIEKERKVEAEKARVLEEKAKAERAEAAKKLEAEQQKAREEKAKLEAQLEKQRKEKEDAERIAKEKEAELARLKEAEELAEKKRIEAIAKAEKKAANAPDKAKLLSLSEAVKMIELPNVKSLEASKIVEDVKTLLGKLETFIKEKAESL